jgi:DNA-directed RNA polymerase
MAEWEVADEPWQFLAACEEYYAVVTKQLRRHTRLPVATDATCSGLQILAGLARDRTTAQLVNVLPSDKPQDAYKVVADTAKPYIPEYLHNVWNRSKVKRTVMTIPYNAKPFSNRTYIRDALKEDGIEIEQDELTLTVKAVRDAMHDIVPGPMAVMSWIEREVSKKFKGKTNLTLTWTTPSGFIVNQRIQKKEVNTISLQLLGRCEVTVATDNPDIADKLRHKAATAPNLIHSLDATLLHFSALRFCGPIALIHDSVLCRATDMTALSSIVRETYMELFAKRDYLTEFADAIDAKTKPPIIDDLEPSEVIDSTYFFC